jgi:hypothetical protein
MKKLIAYSVLTWLLLAFATGFAQDYKQALRFEIKGGLVSSYLSSNDYQDTGVGWGWTAGGGIFLPLFTRSFGAQIEVLFVEKDARATISDADRVELPDAEYNEYDFELTFVEIPIMAQLALYDSPETRFYLLGGGAFAFNTSATIEYIDATTGARIKEDMPNSSDYDFAPLFGLGVRANRFLIEFRFNLGLNSQGDEDTDFKINTTGFLIGLSF